MAEPERAWVLLAPGWALLVKPRETPAKDTAVDLGANRQLLWTAVEP